MARPSVDLPQPLSPIRPRISPRPTCRQTSLTARTTDSACFRSSRSNRPATAEIGLGRDSPTLRAAVRSGASCRGLLAIRMQRARRSGPAAVIGDRLQAGVAAFAAARIEPALRRQVDQVGHLALDRLDRLAAQRQARDRAEQALGVGVARVARSRRAVGPSSTTWPAYITIDPVAVFGHDAEVVGDQHDAHAELGADVGDQFEHLRLDRHVERGGRLVGDQQLRPEASAMAIMMRWRMPPENWCGYCRGASAADGMPTRPSISTDLSRTARPRAGACRAARSRRAAAGPPRSVRRRSMPD